MGRFGLFLFLVVFVPVAVYWASHDFTGLGKLPGEIHALRGERPQPEPTPAPEPEPEEKARPEKEPQPEPPPEPEPSENPGERAKRLYQAGEFDEAATAYAGVDERKRALAQLGAAFQTAFPVAVPNRRYIVLKTRTGDTYEGFAEETSERIKLTEATGKTFSFPLSAIRVPREVPRDEALERIRKEIIIEGMESRITGNRLFALIQAACSMGKPAAAAPLLPRILEIDESKPFFLSVVRHRVPPEYQKELYKAYATCQAPAIMSRESPLVRTPSRLGGNKGKLTERAPKVESSKARTLLTEAAPLRKKGEKLYRKIVLSGLDKASVEDVETAIANFDKAIALYEKAMILEDSNAVNALLRKCSKLNFNLRFWKQQLDSR